MGERQNPDIVDLIIMPDDDPGTSLMMVDGAIDGRPYRFLLDTGAATTCIAFDDYTAQFPVVGHKRSSGVFGSSEDDLITVPSLTIGPIEKRDFRMARLPAGAGGRGNLIGMDVLKDTCWFFEFDQSRALAMQDPEGISDPAWEDLWLDAKSHPYVQVAVGGSSFDAVWDTGAGVTVVDESVLAMHPARFHPAGKSSGKDSSGVTLETDMWMMEGLMLGGMLVPPHKVATVDLSHVNANLARPMGLILGFTTLILWSWWMDFPGSRWRPAPHGGLRSTPS